MAVFTEEEEERGRIDWEVLHDGGIGAFQTAKAFDGAIRDLRDRGYGVAEVSGRTSSAADAHYQPAPFLTDLLSQVSMRYCGWSAKNLDAFCDTLRYIDFDGVTGWVLALRDFDRFFEADARWAVGAIDVIDVIDVIAQVSREHLMRGYRLLTLLHAEGQAVDLGKIGGFKVWWQ